jgi:hypothetical protein
MKISIVAALFLTVIVRATSASRRGGLSHSGLTFRSSVPTIRRGPAHGSSTTRRSAIPVDDAIHHVEHCAAVSGLWFFVYPVCVRVQPTDGWLSVF